MIMQEAGYRWQKSRSWCETGQAARKAKTRGRDGGGSRCHPQKELIEKAYRLGEKMGLAVWVEDEAGPYQTTPYCRRKAGSRKVIPVHQPHEYIRNGTAKMVTLISSGHWGGAVQGVTQSTNAILHPWIKEQIGEILKDLARETGTR